MELLPPFGQFGQSEPNRAAHHPVMGNLPSLNIRINQGSTNTEKTRSSLDVDGALEWVACVRLGCTDAGEGSGHTDHQLMASSAGPPANLIREIAGRIALLRGVGSVFADHRFTARMIGRWKSRAQAVMAACCATGIGVPLAQLSFAKPTISVGCSTADSRIGHVSSCS